MRKIALICCLAIIAFSASSQVEKPRNLPAFDYKTLHWGFTVGLNSMDFAIRRNPLYAEQTYPDVIGFQPAGFQVNIVSDLRLSEYWNLRFLPGINLGSRHFVFFNPIRGETPPKKWPIDKEMTIGSSFLDFPLLLKYRSERVNNYRPYVIGGLSYRLDMSAKTQFSADDEAARILLKKSDVYLEVGFGIDSYLQYFKYSTEIKLAMGLRNMKNDLGLANQEQYANSINSLRSFLVMVNFHFE